MTHLVVFLSFCLVYAFADYVGYNFTRHDPLLLRGYHIAQPAMQGALSVAAWQLASVAAAVAFNLIWWTSGEDVLIYAHTTVLNPDNRWESRGNFTRYVLGKECVWAFWTPIGIMRGTDRSKQIVGSTLVTQAVAGFAVAIGIVIYLSADRPSLNSTAPGITWKNGWFLFRPSD